MIDGTYFREQLSRDVASVGDTAVVEVRLLNGQFHRVHTVLGVEDGYIIVQAYEPRASDGQWKDNWQEQVFGGRAPAEVRRAVIAYESILDVLVLAGKLVGQPRIGFGTAR